MRNREYFFLASALGHIGLLNPSIRYGKLNPKMMKWLHRTLYVSREFSTKNSYHSYLPANILCAGFHVSSAVHGM